MAMKPVIKTYCQLTKEQRAEAKRRWVSPYIGFLYKITGVGKIAYRERRRRGVS